MTEARIRTLLIEDNPGDSRLIQEVLSEAKGVAFDVTCANRLAEGLQHLAGQGADVVLLDLSLPDSRGLETFVKTHAQAPEVPIILLTGLEDELLAVEAVQKGAQDYLGKAYVQLDSILLVRAIRYAIERKRAEKELVRLASFPEQNPNPIIEINLSGAVTYLNPAARAEFPDLSVRPHDHPVIRQLKAATTTLRQHDKPSIALEAFAGNKVYELHVSYVPESNVIRSYSIDITERKQVERLKDEFLSTVSHELRTPLATIKEFIGIIADQIAGPVTADQREYLTIIKTNVERLARIINDLLDMAKIEAGHIALSKAFVQTRALIEQVALSMQPLADTKRLALRCNIPERLPGLYADADKVIQVLVNLLGNAVKFTDGGGQVTVDVAERQNELEFSVTDTGPGIAAGDIPKLFEKFHQLRPNPGGGGSKGTGLGLAISKRLVELHGGRIWVTSVVGQGSTFAFTLPKYELEEVFPDYLEHCIEEAKRRGTRFSLILLTIQNFQALKAQHGVEETGRLLKELELVTREAVRGGTSDVVTRWQEGETVVIAAEVDKAGAQQIAGRITQTIERRSLVMGGQQATVSLKATTATYPDEAFKAGDLLQVTRQPAQQPEAPKTRILVVDDEPKIRQFLLEVLQLRECEVLTAASGPDALEQLKSYRVDLILLDLVMPVMDGYEVYHLLKENPQTKDIPVIILTGKEERKDRQLGLSSAPYHYVLKPFLLDDLLATIRQVLAPQQEPV